MVHKRKQGVIDFQKSIFLAPDDWSKYSSDKNGQKADLSFALDVMEMIRKVQEREQQQVINDTIFMINHCHKSEIMHLTLVTYAAKLIKAIHYILISRINRAPQES